MKYIKKNLTYEKECIICHMNFTANCDWAKYCSDKCKNKHYNRTTGRITGLGLATGTVGAIGELLVSVDLLKKGYEVYRALSPACSGDLIIEKDNKIQKVEVRTGYKNLNQTIYCPKQNIKADIKAIIIHSNKEIEIIYFSKDKKIEL